MRSYAAKLLLAFLVFSVLAGTYHYYMKAGLRKFNDALFGQLDALFVARDTVDILFIGSSRVHHGINPLAAEMATGRSTLNGGLEGAKIHDMETVIKGFLENHPDPAVIFLMLDPHSFLVEKDRMFNKIFFSYYLHNKAVSGSLQTWLGPQALVYRALPAFITAEFDDYLRASAIRGHAGSYAIDKKSQFAYKGYVSLIRNFTPIGKEESFNDILKKEGLDVLKRIADTCAARKIRLVLLRGPYLSSYYEKHRLDQFYDGVRKELNDTAGLLMPEWTMNYGDTKYFKDESHLNAAGADRYTLDLCRQFLR
jgi:hypothetical protein